MWKCTWLTDCPPSKPVLLTTRNPDSTRQRSLAIIWIARKIASIGSGASLGISEMLSQWILGITRTWTGAWGVISWKAMTWASSYTMFAGICFSAILQNKHEADTATHSFNPQKHNTRRCDLRCFSSRGGNRYVTPWGHLYLLRHPARARSLFGLA